LAKRLAFGPRERDPRLSVFGRRSAIEKARAVTSIEPRKDRRLFLDATHFDRGFFVAPPGTINDAARPLPNESLDTPIAKPIWQLR